MLHLSLSLGLLHSTMVLGYVGPGAGLTMLSALFAVVLVLLFALLAPFLYLVRIVRTLLSNWRNKRTVCLDAQLGDESVR